MRGDRPGRDPHRRSLVSTFELVQPVQVMGSGQRDLGRRLGAFDCERAHAAGAGGVQQRVPQLLQAGFHGGAHLQRGGHLQLPSQGQAAGGGPPTPGRLRRAVRVLTCASSALISAITVSGPRPGARGAYQLWAKH